MKFNTFHETLDTDNIRHNSDTSIAFDALTKSIRTLTGDRDKDYCIKFLNSFIFDACNEGITADGHIILHSNDLALKVMEHKGDTYCGYWFRCNIPQAMKAVEKVYKNLETDSPSTIKNRIGTITLQSLNTEE